MKQATVVSIAFMAMLLSLGCAREEPKFDASLSDAIHALLALEEGRYEQALRLSRPLAERGDDNGQYVLAFQYQHGLGVTRDYAEALKWYRKSAKQGNPSAQKSLAEMYAAGQGMPQDNAEAFKWYNKAAKQGDRDALCKVAVLYRYGQGVRQDYDEAYTRLQSAADKDCALAQLELGALHLTGFFGQSDVVRAHVLFSSAVFLFQNKDVKNRDRAIKYLTDVESWMSPSQITKAKQDYKTFREGDYFRKRMTEAIRSDAEKEQ